jgi:hypothetical protein
VRFAGRPPRESRARRETSVLTAARLFGIVAGSLVAIGSIQL